MQCPFRIFVHANSMLGETKRSGVEYTSSISCVLLSRRIPVISRLSTMTSSESIIRQSAGTESPDRSCTTSPITRFLPCVICCCPSRITVTFSGIRFPKSFFHSEREKAALLEDVEFVEETDPTLVKLVMLPQLDRDLRDFPLEELARLVMLSHRDPEETED